MANSESDSKKCPTYKKQMDKAHPVILLIGVTLGWVAKAFFGSKKK